MYSIMIFFTDEMTKGSERVSNVSRETLFRKYNQLKPWKSPGHASDYAQTQILRLVHTHERACWYLQVDPGGEAQLPALPHTSYLAFSKWFNISAPQFPHLSNMYYNSIEIHRAIPKIKRADTGKALAHNKNTKSLHYVVFITFVNLSVIPPTSPTIPLYSNERVHQLRPQLLLP